MSSDIPIEEDSKTTSARLSNSPTFLSESHGSTFDTIISPTSVPFQTSSTSSHTSLTTPYESILYQPNIIQFDPKASPSADEEEGDIDIEDNGQNNAGAGPRLKKRKSTMSLRNVSRSTPSNNLRSAANTDAFNAGFATLAGSTHLATEADYNFGMGMLMDDEDKDKGRRKIQIEYIEEKSKRHITFSKRKAGIMKKAYELSTLTGTQVLLLVVSESGWVYTFTTDKFKPLVKEDEYGNLSQGQKLIAACLETPEKMTSSGQSSNRSSGSGPSGVPPPVPIVVPQARDFEVQQNLPLGNKTRTGRPTASNRRVSGSKGRPPPIRTDLVPPVPGLPSPISGNLLGLQPGTPIYGLDNTRPRSMSMHPASPMRLNAAMLQQQQQEQHIGLESALGLHSPLTAGGQEYLDMLQRSQFDQPPHYLAQPQPTYASTMLHHHPSLQNFCSSNQPDVRHDIPDSNLSSSASNVSRQYQLHQQQQLQQHQLLHGVIDSSIYTDEITPRSSGPAELGLGMGMGNSIGEIDFQSYAY